MNTDMEKQDPFFFYSKSLPKILFETRSSILYSTYQSRMLVFISSRNGTSISKYAKVFKRPMGIAYDASKSKLAVATKYALEVFSSNKKMAWTYPESPERYGYLFVPQAKYYTGFQDVHEIDWVQDELWITSTLFSCLGKVTDQHHFTPTWQPPFISEITPEDRCHLNGLVCENGQPAYVTMFGKSDTKEGWRLLPPYSGLIMDVRNNKVILEGLHLPHSPCLVNNQLYFIQSGTGEVCVYDVAKKKLSTIAQFDTFLRGIQVVDNYIIVGSSLVRPETQISETFRFDKKKSYGGIIVLDRETGERVGGLDYIKKVKEIFSIKWMPNMLSPAILTEDDDDHKNCILLEEDSGYWIKEKK